jgi:hypothetical protein
MTHPNSSAIAKLEATFEQFAALLKQTFRPPPPRLGDGRYDEEAVPESIPTGLIKDIAALGIDMPADPSLFTDTIKAAFKGETDDKKYLVIALARDAWADC